MALRVGIVGTGWGVKTQVPAFRKAGLVVVALCGRDLAKTSKAAQELGIPHALNDWKALVQHKEVDVVSVVTPPDTHAAISVAALKAGKHVLCDKPTAFNLQAAIEMAKAAQAAPGQIAWIDHELRFLDTAQKMKAAVQDPAFGHVLYIDLRMLSSFGSLTSPFNWWHEAKAGGGALGAVGSHMVDLVSYVTGHKVISVSGQLAALKSQIADDKGVMHTVTADHYASGSLTFSGGFHGSLLITSTYHAGPERRLIVASDKRVATLDLVTATLTVVEGRTEVLTTKDPLPSKQETGMEENVWCAGSILIGNALKESIAARNAKSSAPLEAIASSFANGVYIQDFLDSFRASAATGGASIKLQNPIL